MVNPERTDSMWVYRTAQPDEEHLRIIAGDFDEYGRHPISELETFLFDATYVELLNHRGSTSALPVESAGLLAREGWTDLDFFRYESAINEGIAERCTSGVSISERRLEELSNFAGSKAVLTVAKPLITFEPTVSPAIEELGIVKSIARPAQYVVDDTLRGLRDLSVPSLIGKVDGEGCKLHYYPSGVKLKDIKHMSNTEVADQRLKSGVKDMTVEPRQGIVTNDEFEALNSLFQSLEGASSQLIDGATQVQSS